MFRHALVTCLTLITLAATSWAEPAPLPESHLLLPYFEVSLEGLEEMTFFSIVNASHDELFLTAKVYTNWAIPMFEVEILLDGKEVRSINLHDWIVAGQLPDGATICAGGDNECLDLQHIQQALAGRPSTMTQLYYGSEFEDGVATGFITITADNGFLPESDVLWGDYFYTNPVENFAQGQRLVRREPNLSCADLCTRHSIRFLEGGGFSGGTKLTVWNWDGIERRPSEFPAPQFEYGSAQINVYDQDGKLVDVIPQLNILPAQPLLVSDLNINKPFGWFELSTREESTVSGFYRAMGRFSVGVPAWCLPCDPCDQNSHCFEAGNPQCTPGDCIPVELSVSGDTRGVVGQAFSLTFRFSGSPEVVIEVDDLPDGLVHQNGTIFGIPRETGRFIIRATNDCGFDEIVVEITPGDDPPPEAFLTLVKQVVNDNGGTATVEDFPLFVDGLPMTSGVRTRLPLETYRASEQSLPGYTAGSWTGDCSPTGEVTLNDGDDKTCIIINDDQPATITLVKHVDGGTALVQDFDLFVGSTQVTSGAATELPPGDYTASEHNLPGYTAGAWTGDCAPDGSVSLALGEHKVCEITNSSQPAKITLVKHVINDDGGTARVADFALYAGHQQVTSGVEYVMAPGTYVASEDNLPGYTAGPWRGDCSPDGTVTLVAGEHKVCEITNDDQPAKITLVKHVINDDGGTASVSDFDLFVGSQAVTSGVAYEMPPGDYAASERNLPGYEAGSWSGDCAANGAVTLVAGEHKVCEITNDDRPAKITLVKHVINDNGGTASVSDFDLFVGSQVVTSGVAYEMPPGDYAASERNLPGYEAGPWGGDCAANGAVTLVAGEHKVCEITNDDRPAKITLVKHVINDDGGSAGVSDFALFVGSQPVTSGVAYDMAPGDYVASEQNLPGYQAGAWGGDCAANGAVTLVAGEHKVCEITNDDDPVCDPTPTFAVWNGLVDYNDPHSDRHHTEVSFNFRVDGEVDGEVQIFWRNGGSTYIKKRVTVSLDCDDEAFEGRLFWQSDSRSHHPGHGAQYSARLVINGNVVQSIPLN